MDLQLTAMLAVLFVSVACAAGAAFWLLTDPQQTRRRLSEVAGGTGNAAAYVSVIGDLPSAMVQRASGRCSSWEGSNDAPAK